MRTTLKRGVGRGAALGAAANGNGRAVFPPGAVSTVTRYRQPPPPGRSGLGLLGRILLITFLVLSSAALAVAGGSYLYFHQSIAAVQASTPDVKQAQKALDIPKANAPAIALVIGYDHRAGIESANPSLSDTLMLIRADPVTKTISLLSFPRDLDVPIYCSASAPVTTDRINSAYSRCGSKGTLLTVGKLTGLPINYLITVNFHGFKEVVDKLGGVWMDVDRRYYNRNTGSYLNNYANINLQPGYQRLTGQQALDFVRFRHTDDDLHRVARQQAFVRSFREQVSTSFSPFKVPSLVNAITSNVEVAEGGHKLQGKQVYNYALFAYGLPAGHVFQDKIDNVVCSLGCSASQDEIQKAVQDFLESRRRVVEGGERRRARSQDQAEGAARVIGGRHRSERQRRRRRCGRHVVHARPARLQGADAAEQPRAECAAPGLLPHDDLLRQDAGTVEGGRDCAAGDDAARRRRSAARGARRLHALDPGSMLMVVLGTAFHGSLGATTTKPAPKHQAAYVRYDASQGTNLLKPLANKVKFKLMVPTVLERNSYPDTLPSDKPVRRYYIDKHHKAVRLVFRTGARRVLGRAGNGLRGRAGALRQELPARPRRA